MRKIVSAVLTMIFGTMLCVGAANATKAEIDISSIKPSLTAGANKFIEQTSQDFSSKLTSLALKNNNLYLVGDGEMQAIYEKYRPEPEPEPELEEEEVIFETSELVELEMLIQAEGYTMGEKGMEHLTSVVLNRAASKGCTIRNEIYSGAYTVVSSGAMWNQSYIYPETQKAVETILANGPINDALYFRTNHYHTFGTPLFHYGNVYFSN